jgi:predicted CopG family antitoxin
MGSKTISLKDEAYSRLKALKNDDKSFSDIILEITEDKNAKFENIVGEGIDTSFEELKEKRKRSEKDDEREALLRGH